MKSLLKTFTAVAIFAMVQQSASAALLIEYDFTGSTASATTNSEPTLLTASTFTSTAASPGFNTSPSNNAPSGSPTFFAYNWNTDEAGASYYAFEVSIDSGHFLQIDSFSLYQWSRGTHAPTVTGPAAYKLVVSESADFSTGTTELGRGTLTPSGTVNFEQISGDNGGTPVTMTGTAYFRIYGWDGNSGTGVNTDWRIDDVALNGSVLPIPEPGVGVLTLFAGLLFLMKRRRFC